jgi:hypothetical protein
MKNEKVMKQIERDASSILTAWASEVKVRYDDSPYRLYKKPYVLKASHSWGSAYCDWLHHKDELKSMLRKNGATKISGKVGWNFVCLEFDLKKSLQKEEN